MKITVDGKKFIIYVQKDRNGSYNKNKQSFQFRIYKDGWFKCKSNANFVNIFYMETYFKPEDIDRFLYSNGVKDKIIQLIKEHIIIEKYNNSIRRFNNE